ncbi:MAG: 4Fe-4S binding protein [Verrucomicrobia bacterium]|nr:4Fe-4S binding protein [Verrucomicrobiota bacterium]
MMNPGRRRFIRFGGQLIGASVLGTAAWRVFTGSDPEAVFSQPKGPYVWRINPHKCTFCGLCETACVRTPAAVKAVNDQKKCSYCVACYGHLSDLHVASEMIQSKGVRVCSHDAVLRKEHSGGQDGYHLYTIDDAKCTACGKCAKRCNQLGTKSMFLIIRPDLCLGCNRCAIAAICPDDAIEWAHSYPEDDFRGDYGLENMGAEDGLELNEGAAAES